MYKQTYEPRNLLRMVPYEQIYQTSIRERQAADLKEAFSQIPFSGLNKVYSADNISNVKSYKS